MVVLKTPVEANGEMDNKGSPDSNLADNNSQEKHPKTASEAFATILRSVGGFGKWQWKLAFITGCGLFTNMHAFGAVFLAASPEHWCKVPTLNLTLSESEKLINFTIPWERNNEDILAPSECTYINRSYSDSLIYEYLIDGGNNFTTVNSDGSQQENGYCTSWYYDKSVFKSTLVTEFNLVCERKWIQPTVQATFMLGMMIGSVLFSSIADNYGRKLSALISLVLLTSSSIGTAVSPTLGLILFLRFLNAMAVAGLYLCIFVIVSEVSEGQGRTWFPMIFQSWTYVGMALTAVLAYCLREWRHLQLATSVPTVILFSYFWLLPESPRWLFMKGRFDEGIQILKQIAKVNGGTLPDEAALDSLISVVKEGRKQEKSSNKGGIAGFIKGMRTLLGTPNMRRRCLIVFYGWFVSAATVYGLSFSGQNLNISLYVLHFSGGLIGMIITPIIPAILLKIGRRSVLLALMFLGTITTLGVLFVPNEYEVVLLALTTTGRQALNAAFTVWYILASELVPTEVRNLSMGMSSFCARIGSISSPYVVDLLGAIYYVIPSAIFGILALIGGLLCFLLPETGKKSLPETVEEVESQPR